MHEHVEFELSSGRIVGRRWGPSDGPVTVCIPGFSGSDASYDAIGPRVAGSSRQVIAVSLRGRGRSETTPVGTYGARAHARDVREIASQLGVSEVNLIGWSFGGLVAMQVVQDAPGLVQRVVLIDALGTPEPAAMVVIGMGVAQVSQTYATQDEYLESMTASGVLDGCPEAGRAYALGEMTEENGRFRRRASPVALADEATHRTSQDSGKLWATLVMPTLLVRSSIPILPGTGFIVRADDRDRWVAMDPVNHRVVEIAANHYCIGFADESADAIATFLDD